MKKGSKSNRSFGHHRHFTKYLIVSFVCLSIVTFVFSQTTTYMIYIIGDSTVCNYAASKYPWAGWGQELPIYFKSGTVTISNQAIGGRSSKSFYVEGRWTSNVQSVLKSGDFVLIQFGHNDRDYTDTTRYADTTTYKKYLHLYVNESRAKGAIPVFISPMNMNTWNGTELREVFTERQKGADYRGAMMNVAKELNVPFIDLEKKSADFMKSVGQSFCTSYHFMGLKPGEYPNYPDGNTDITHFQEMGSLINARMVAEGIKELAMHPDVGKLASVLAPLNVVTVKANKASTGLVTVSGNFPAGATVTLKVMPNSGETFQNWADASGKSVSTSKLYSFVMGNTPVTYNAMFKGGSAVGVDDGKTCKIKQSAVVMKTDKDILYIKAGSSISSVELFDIRGNLLSRKQYGSKSVTISLNRSGNGVYCVKVITDEGVSISSQFN